MKSIRCLKKYRKLNDIAGTTMVEVLVAFLVVMIMVGMFSKVVTVSTHLLNQAKDTITKTEEFDKEYYKKSTVNTPVNKDLKIVLDKGNGTGAVEIALPGGVYQKYSDTDKETARYSFGITDSETGK